MFAILFAILATCCLVLWWLSSPFHWKRKGVPYLLPLPIFGNYLPIFRNSLQDFYNKLYNQFPNEKYFGIHFFMKPALFVRDPAVIKDIFIRDFEYFSWNGMYSNENDPFGENLLFLHGQAWKDLRTKLSPMFTPSKLKNLREYVDTSMIKVDKCIKNKIMLNEPIKMEQLTVGIATDVIVQALFGIETDCFEEKSKFVDVGKQMFCDETNFKILLSIVSPKLNNIFKMKIFGENVNIFLKNILKDVMKYRETNNINNQDFLDYLLKIIKTSNGNTQGRYYQDKTKVPDYDFNTLLSQALILYAGGAESAAMTMAFLLYELSLHQDMQDKCRDEVMAVVNETGKDVQVEDFNKLTYLDMAIKETMRKHPAFIILTRKCTKTYKFRDSDLTIEPGSIVLLPVISTQMDPKFYPNPEEFIPERFSESSSVDPGTYYVWGLGPKTCLGKNFARVEMLLVISRLLRNYKFTLSSKTEVPVKLCAYTTVMTPCHGIYLNAESLSA